MQKLYKNRTRRKYLASGAVCENPSRITQELAEKRRNNQSARELLYCAQLLFYYLFICLCKWARWKRASKRFMERSWLLTQLLQRPHARVPFSCVYTICCYKKCIHISRCIESGGVRWIIRESPVHIWIYTHAHIQRQITAHTASECLRCGEEAWFCQAWD